MPLIEVYARWHDAEGKYHREFVSSLSTTADELRSQRTVEWMRGAVIIASNIERQRRDEMPEENK